MRRISTSFAVLFGGLLILFSAGVANAQSFSYSSVTIGSGGFSFHLEESNFGVHIQQGPWGNHIGVHIDNRRRQRHPQIHHRRHRDIYRNPPVIIHQPPIIVERRPVIVHPQPIQIVVIESRQVQEPVYYRDRHGNLCPTGSYRLVWRDVEVVKTAHWDSQYGAYVYYNSHGQLVIYNR